MKRTQDEGDWIFVGDGHFTGRHPGEMDSFLALLETEKGRMAHLVILGDLFEFLFGFKKTSQATPSPFVFDEYLPVLQQLQQLSKRVLCMTYLEGNHDFQIEILFSGTL